MDFVGLIIEMVNDVGRIVTYLVNYVGRIIETVNDVGRIVTYLEDQRKFNDFLVEFYRRKDDLLNRKQDIESKLLIQLRHGKVAKPEVRRWLDNDVETFIRRPAVEEEVNSWGWLSWYHRVKIVKERAQELEEIYERGGRYTDECLVTDDLAASAVELPVPKLQGNEAVEEILACLEREEVVKLGVWGMGGIGKTTIMKHIHNELQKQPKFKKIIWVTVSKDTNTYDLQKQIAGCLKEQLTVETNDVVRAKELFQMLKEDKHKPYLLILDDVWSCFNLEEVGVPEPNVTNGCKLVVTTRLQEVARSMDCIIKVKTLPKDEALKLFLKKVGDAALSCPGGGIKRDLQSTLKDIVDECDGLPLALITVAGSLKGISDSRLWSDALNQLRDCNRNVAGTNADEFRILKFSYDRLENPKIQDCFLYCALYPEDYKILEEKIIEDWIDEGFINEKEPRQSMKDAGYGFLKKLEDNSLLELIEDEVRGDCVRMHDLIRDMALHITRTSSRFLVEAGKALKELPERVNCAESVEKVSLMHNSIEEIPSSLAFSRCIRLTTLLLAHNGLSTIPESVFEHMPELKVLDLSFNRQLSNLPNSVSKLVKLTTLLLEETSLEKVPSLSGLGSLKKLNLRGTEIKQVPEGLGMLKNLKCLFLRGSKIDEIADGVLSNLSTLQELIVDGIDGSRIKLKGDVVGRLKKLEVFHGWFPTVNDMRIFLECQPNRLSSYAITVGSVSMTYSMEELLRSHRITTSYLMAKSQRYKRIMVFKEVSIVGENLLFPSVQVLRIVDCPSIRSLNDFASIKVATDLKRCLILKCDGMDCILSSWMDSSFIQTLQYLYLDGLNKLEGLFEANVMATSSPPPRAFSSLQEVAIWRCKKIKKLFSSWKLVEYLQSLERIIVNDCEEMEEILASDPEEGEEGGDIIKKLILPKLKELSVENLPALKSICSRRAIMVCDSLEEIEIRDCKGLRRIPFRLPLLFLKKVEIERCKKIKKLFPSWKLVEYLQSLERITVKDCEEMEEIIASDPEEEGGDIIKKLILPKLKELSVGKLPALKSICSRRAIMVCDSLESIKISNCNQLRRIPFCLPLYLSLYGLDNLEWLFEVELIAMSPTQPHTFSFLKEVVIERCKKIKKLFSSWKLVEYLQSLERIRVNDCEEMEEILASDPEGGGDIIKKLILPKLKELSVQNLPALKSICSRRAIIVCDSLESIQISYCKKIKKLFPSWKFLEYLQSLKRIEVIRCEQMEEIIASDPEEEGGGDIIKKLILPKLHFLGLSCLPALKSICSSRAVMVCDSLDEIKISNCKGIRRIPFHLLSHLSLYEGDNLDWLFEVESIAMSPPQLHIFSSLKAVEIWSFKNLKKLFPSWKFLEYLQSLERIEVYRCEEMEEIIGSDPGEEGENIIKKLILPKLKQLKLSWLPALKSICSRRAIMVCDSLESITIGDCKGLRRIPFRLPPYLSLQELDNLDWLFEVELIAMSPPQLHTFSSLKAVQIWYFKNLKKLFPSWKFLEYLQSLESILVQNCEEMEEIIGSDPEEEGEGGDIIKKLILPKLKNLELSQLPALKSICSRRAVMVCDSLESITIRGCRGLKRIPLYLYLPLVDNAQPSPPPSLKEIKAFPQGWWESLEWDHPNAKDVLRPMLQICNEYRETVS